MSWSKVRALFEQALELAPGARPDLLARVRAETPELAGELEAMLRWHEAASGFLEPGRLEIAEPPKISDRLGPYRLLSRLGVGGMGTVYLAERADALYQKKVAVKVLQPGALSPEIPARFRAERQILASLEHPNIARLLDGGGDAEGVPYLVMEYVDGMPIDTFCAQRGLDVDARLRLFLKVCDAVRVAHQSLIVHRDLKPSNILVTAEGEPKLLDFGIAKLLEPERFPATLVRTTAGFGPLTPAYASPEQLAGGKITALTDVYSLGVLLYELLTDRRPHVFESTRLDEMTRIVCETDPERPSTVVRRQTGAGSGSADPARLARRLSGDLDAIVLMALRKEPERRYGSVEQLAQDVENELAGRPVRARPDGLGYRASRFVRRHRLAVGASAAGLAVLLGLLVGLLLQRQSLLEQRRQLVEERNRARTTANLLVDVFASPDPAQARGQDVMARELLERGVDEIRWQLADQPAVRADLLSTMGRSYQGLGLYESARPLFEEALALRRGAGEPESTAGALHELAELATLEGRYEDAERLAGEALELRRARAPESLEVAESLTRLARIRELRGDFAEAERLFEQALALARPAGPSETLATALERYGVMLRKVARLEPAESALREALEVALLSHGEVHPQTAAILNDLGLALAARGRLEEAEQLLRRAERAQRKLYGAEHSQLANTLNNLGQVAIQRGSFLEAEALLGEALAMAPKVLPESHPIRITCLHNLADLRAAQGRWAEAEPLYHQALAMRRAALGEQHADTAQTLSNLGRVVKASGRREEAETIFRQALAATEAALGNEHPRTAVMLNNLADTRQDAGDLAEAETLYHRAIEINRKVTGARDPELAAALHNLGSLQLARGEIAAARASLEEAVAISRTTLGEDHLRTAMVRLGLAAVLRDQGEVARARDLALQSLGTFEKSFPEDDPWRAAARRIAEESREGMKNEGGSG